MKAKTLKIATAACCASMALSCAQQPETVKSEMATVGNPFLPLWEHIPDGEPYVFEDPDNPGKQRVYIYGSHDDIKTDYCGRDQVVWSAPVEDLTHWRYDGEILVVDKNANGEPFDSAGTADVLFAPDVTMVTGADGKKTYYLFPNDQAGGRNGLIAKSDRPNGPFEVCNWSKDNPNVADGVLQFDPAVFVDDDGRVYGYWGFERSYAAEFDPTTMATVKPGTQIVEDMISGRNQQGVFSFFEASSIRKIKDKYVFYHRQTGLNEFARQAMVAPITVEVEEGKGGKVTISEGEYNSNGFALNGLDPFERHSAGIACWYTGPKPAIHEWPNNTFFGSYVEASYGTDDNFEAPYDLRNNTNCVVNNTDGSIVGYKYFNFDAERLANKDNLMLVLRLIPEGVDGTIEVMMDRPWTSQGGKKIGEIALKADMEKNVWDAAIGISKEAQENDLAGQHAIFLLFKSDTKEKSLCTLQDLVFTFAPNN